MSGVSIGSGVGAGGELTTSEESFIQTLVGLPYVAGDTLFHTGSAISRLAIGSPAQVLTVSGGLPAWVTPSASGLSADTTITSSLTIGTASSVTGALVFLNSSNANTLTIKPGATAATYSWTLPTAQGGVGTVLKNNGTGVLTWVNGLVYDATVGSSNADYPSVRAAILDNKKIINIISSVTETADTNVPSGTTKLFININPGVTWNLSRFSIYTVVACDYFISGRGTLTYARTANNDETFGINATDNIYVTGITIDNNSTGTTCYFSTGIEHIRGVRFELPNVDGCGFNASGFNNTYDDIDFVGGGSSCSQAFVTTNEGDNKVSNLRFSGTFKTATNPPSGTLTEYAGVFRGCVANNLVFNQTGSASYFSGISSIANLTYGDNATEVILNFNGFVTACNYSGSDQITSHVFCTAGDNWVFNFDMRGSGNLDVTSSDKNFFTNITLDGTGTIDLTDTGCTNNKFVNCRQSLALTVAGDRNQLTNCDLLGGVSVSNGADNNSFVNCQAGADAGGGALTITVVAGSNNTRIVGCMTDAAISDGGTGTVTAANVVY